MEVVKAPASVLAAIEVENEVFRLQTETYEAEVRKHLEWIKAQEEELKLLSPSLSLSLDENRWIDTAWLWKWLTREPTDSLGGISNGTIQCVHGAAADPRHLGTDAMQLIPATAWTALHTRYKGGPELAADVCHLCAQAEEEAQRRESASRALQRQGLARLLMEGGRFEASKVYLLDGSWITDWRQAMESDDASRPGSPRGASCCEAHGKLIVDPALVLRRVTQEPRSAGSRDQGEGTGPEYGVRGRQEAERDKWLAASVCMVTEEEGRVLGRAYGVEMSKLPSCEVDLATRSVSKLAPSLCVPCSVAEGERVLCSLLEYLDAEVRYEQLTAPPSGREAHEREGGNDRRGEHPPPLKKARRRPPALSHGVVTGVRANFSVLVLKERICYAEGGGWKPCMQRLFIDGRELSDDEQTLSQAGVFPNSLVHVHVTVV